MGVLGSLTQTDLDDILVSTILGVNQKRFPRGAIGNGRNKVGKRGKTYDFVRTRTDKTALFRCRQTGELEILRYKVKL